MWRSGVLRRGRRSADAGMPRILVIVASVAAVSLIGLEEAHGQRTDRSGKQVVDAVCAACHATGKDGAPKIGDETAWSPRAAQGLTALTQHAIQGIRQMPAHGGNPGVTDFELERAVTYMVNQSGGHWAEPVNKAALPAVRSGAQVVQMQCATCHQKGEGGAPKIGDKDAWIPHLRQGVDAAVRSAIRGHGGMPARGGMTDLTDRELRSAVIYMFNPVSLTSAPAPAAPAVARKGMHKVVAGMDVYLGIVPAASLRVQQSRGFETQQMHGGIPRGKGYYHLNVSLLNSATKAEITDAHVEATVEDPVMGEDTKALDTMVFNDTISYGNYFRMPGHDPYRITVHITKPGGARPVSAEFDFRHY